MDVFSHFLYASKAFDRVKHSMIFTKLLRRGAPGYIVGKIAHVLVCASDNVC